MNLCMVILVMEMVGGQWRSVANDQVSCGNVEVLNMIYRNVHINRYIDLI